MKKLAVGPPLRVEELESRLVPSALSGHLPRTIAGDGLHPNHSAQRSGTQPAVRLDLVALHEFGHALGLEHHASSASIMFDGYNANYNKNNLAADPAVVANPNDGYTSLLELYADARIADNTTSWKDGLDARLGNGRVDLTYSFIPDGAQLPQGARNTLFTTFDRLYGRGNWQSIFGGELNRWGSASGNRLVFTQISDNGSAFDAAGAVQNDARFGDIRIGARTFDGQGLTLANAYFPPPNGATAPGDTHFDEAENWDGRASRGPGSISDSEAIRGGARGGGGSNASMMATRLPSDQSIGLAPKTLITRMRVATPEIGSQVRTFSVPGRPIPVQTLARVADLVFTSDTWALGFWASRPCAREMPT